ncbi:MAG: YidC/Oxa1 family membrane protein insertase [Chloroflexota bacterium]
MGIGDIWNFIILQPVLNSLVVTAHVLFGSFGLTIIAFTLVIRGLMYPLTVKQTHATKAMQTLQPKLTELQKKYAKDKQKLGQEQMKLYKESGVSPAGCMVPMLIQMPIWIALYQSIIRVLAVSPEDFLNLSQYLYSWPVVYSMLPLNSHFLWLDLTTGDTFLALLVGATMWLQQKMVTPVTTDPKQQSQSRMMLWMMPMMFTFLSMQFPSGLALYWVISNVITIVIQYFVTGWGGLVTALPKAPQRDSKYRKRLARVEQASSAAVSTGADIVETEGEAVEAPGGTGSGAEPPAGKGGYPASLRNIRQRSSRGRGHTKRRKI